MGSMQCNVEFGYQLSICSGTKENHGKPWSSWPVAGTSECNWLLASRPALNSRTVTLVPTLCYCSIFFPVFLFFSLFYNKLFCFYNYLYVHMIWISNKTYQTLMEGIKAYVNKHSYKHIVLSSFHYKKENTSHFTSLHSMSLLICQLLVWNNKHKLRREAKLS
jgi:hypothetical protein